MKIELFKIKPHIKKSKKNINPEFYWSVVFYLGFICTILFFVSGFYLFRQTSRDYKSDAQNTFTHAGNIKKERIDAVLEYFNQGDTKREEIQSKPSPVVDPSL
jgi:hypothetical protein